MDFNGQFIWVNYEFIRMIRNFTNTNNPIIR